MSCLTASCPGKVLIVGGYLVLQDEVPGLVVAVTSRFHTTVEVAPSTSPQPSAPWAAPVVAGVAITVASPQFGSTWVYDAGVTAAGVALVVPRPHTGRNTFVESALFTTLTALRHAVGAHGLACVFHDVTTRGGGGLVITLRADNDFYSQRAALVDRGLPLTIAALNSLPPFLPCPRDPATGKVVVSKTGLGSSAALVTSLVAAVASWVQSHPALAPAGGDGAALTAARPWCDAGWVHTVAQVAHGWAQGKVGSGFDVASAALGSIAYRRIPSAVLGSFMARVEAVYKHAAATGEVGGADDGLAEYATLALQLCTVHREPGKTGWAFGASPLSLPRGLRLVLADVAGGSETPGMVRKVLSWREGEGVGDGGPISTSTHAAPSAAHIVEAMWASGDCGKEVGVETAEGRAAREAQVAAMVEGAAVAHGPLLWRQLAAANARVECVLSQLRALAEGDGREEYDAALSACSRLVVGAWQGVGMTSHVGAATVTRLTQLAAAFHHTRALLRAMGNAAGVPIEPPEQTALADATCGVPGVVGAGVPGAGGYDALFAVYIGVEGDSRVRDGVEEAWRAWPGGGLAPLTLTNGPGMGEVGAGVQIHWGAPASVHAD